MPLAVIYMLSGRDQKIKKELMKKVSQAIHESLSVPLENVRIIIQEVPPEQWGIAGLPWDEYRAKKKQGDRCIPGGQNENHRFE